MCVTLWNCQRLPKYEYTPYIWWTKLLNKILSQTTRFFTDGVYTCTYCGGSVDWKQQIEISTWHCMCTNWLRAASEMAVRRSCCRSPRPTKIAPHKKSKGICWSWCQKLSTMDWIFLTWENGEPKIQPETKVNNQHFSETVHRHSWIPPSALSTISRTLELSLQSLYGEKSEKHWLSQYHPSWMGCELPHDSPLSDQSTRFGTSLPCSRLFPQISDCEPGLLTRFLWQCKKGGRWLNVLFSHVC